MKTFSVFVFVAALIVGSAYIQWWRCGEMFPNAQLACFIRGGE